MENTIAFLGRALFLTALIGYGLSFVAYLAYIIWPKTVPKALPTTILIIVSALNIGIVILRSIESGRSPFSSRYESITFFGMTIGVIYLLTEWRLRVKFGGLFASAIAFGLFAYIVVVDLNKSDVPITFANIVYMIKAGGTQLASMPLMPALQSPWFFWHVSLAFLGYAFFTTGFVSEMTASCISVGRKADFGKLLWKAVVVLLAGAVLMIIGYSVKGMLWLEILSTAISTVALLIIIGMLLGKRHTSVMEFTDDNLATISYFAHSHVLFAFPLLTWCVVSGGAWADKAWGTYWGWDPKEIWSLITWFIYVCYFHMKTHPKWRGRPAVIMHVLGFLSVMTTYLMVNYLVEWFNLFSLHAYTE